MIGHILWQLWYWPGGIVLGNVLASVLWASVFEWRLKVHHRKIHQSVHEAIHGKDHDA